MSDDPTQTHGQPQAQGPQPDGDTAETDEQLTLTWREADGEPSLDRAIPHQLGSVRLIREIGRGGMGVVWLGRDGLLDRDVAVKFLLGAVAGEGDPHFKQFLEGARAEASLRHANIVSVYSAGVVGDLPYLVMDYIDGPSLGQVVKKVGPMTVATALGTVSEVAAAVSVLHKRGIVHRDLKPTNVLLDRDGQVLVTDFGLASLHRGRDGVLGAAGTPAYMAPEAFEGKASPQTDVYAMGMMLFELLGGSLAGVGGVAARRARQANEPLAMTDLPDEVPSELREVIERATHTQAIFRYKTAEHFQRALSDTVAGDDLLRDVDTELKTLVARSIIEPAAETPTKPTETTPGSSYFDRLSEFAAKKRRASAPAAPTEPAVTPVPQEAPDQRRITQDVPCVGCGYNLRSLSPTANCPECNEAVSSSLDSERLLFADQRWLSKVARGSTLFFGATFPLLWLLVLGLPFQVMSLVDGASWPAVGSAPFVCASTLILGAMTAGIFLSTTPEPHRATAVWGKTARLSALLLCCGAFASVGLVGVGDVIAWVYRVIWAGLFVLTVAAMVLHLSAHARRIPDLKLARRLRVVAVVFVPVGLLCVAAFVLAVTRGGARVSYLSVIIVAFLVAIELVWALVGLHRRAVKLAITQAVPFDGLFGPPAARPAEEPGIGTPTGPAVAGVDVEAAIVRDVPCVGCGYNLRGLTGRGNCPECNELVSSSLRPDRLMFADTRWLSRVRLGQTVIYASLAGWALFGPALLWPGLRGYPESVVVSAFSLIGLATIVVLVVGVFLSTSGEPGPRRTKSILAGPWVVRWSVLVAVAATVGALRLPGAARSADVLTDWHPALVALGTALWFLAAAALLLASVSLLRYLMTLADRMPDRKLARRTWQAEILLCGVTILLAAWSVTSLPVLQGARDWILLATILLVLGTVLCIWSLMGVYRRGIKQTISAAVPHSELFGASGPPPGVVVAPAQPAGQPASEAERRTAPPKNPGGILKLSRCPQCDYSLEGLPRRHRCPECGFEYDESMFVLRGWAREMDQPSIWATYFWTTRPVFVIPFVAVLLLFIVSSVWEEDWFAILVLVGSLMLACIHLMWRRHVRRTRGGTIQYTFSVIGVAQRRGVGRPDFIPWNEFRRFRCRRFGREHWRFSLRRGIWCLHAYPGAPRPLFGGPEIAGIIECNEGDSALLDDEIGRRLQASRLQ